MINRGKRRSIQPMVVSSNSSSKLKRVAFENTWEEGLVQPLIENNPELLPVGDIEPAFAPLISIGREVETKVGYIDHLFINSQGYITIVETKLWRNPEARRTVVGQIIDYATELSHWNFDQLDESVRKYNKDKNKRKDKDFHADKGIIDTIRTQEDIAKEDEPEIIDTISRNLKQGKFLLLIVGDGIRESVEDMVEYLQCAPNLQFTLALVELQIYELKENQGNNELLIVPQIITRTSEITRAVIKIEAKEISKIVVTVDKGLPPSPMPKRFSLTEEAFYHELPEKYAKLSKQIQIDMEARGCLIDWKQASFMVKLPDPGGSGRLLSLFGVWKSGDLSTGLWWLPSQLKELSISSTIADEFAVNTARLLNVPLSKKDHDIWEGNPNISTLSKCYPEFLAEIDKLIDNIKKGSLPEA